MTPLDDTQSIHDRPCIHVDLTAGGVGTFTVAEYERLQREPELIGPGLSEPVEKLTTQWLCNPYIGDPDAYRAQMRRLIGID